MSVLNWSVTPDRVVLSADTGATGGHTCISKAVVLPGSACVVAFIGQVAPALEVLRVLTASAATAPGLDALVNEALPAALAAADVDGKELHVLLAGFSHARRRMAAMLCTRTKVRGWRVSDAPARQGPIGGGSVAEHKRAVALQIAERAGGPGTGGRPVVVTVERTRMEVIHHG